jgi:predicted glycoside hydrolase/deacetylase ChbG (UPF0249 family)
MSLLNKKIILSADDFGISPKANFNVIQLIQLGKIDRVEVMVDGCLEKEDISQLLSSGLKIDLHLNSTQKVFPRILEKRGVFKRLIKFSSRYFSGKNGAENVKIEWEKQIEKFKILFGKIPDGISSHEHIHYLPAYFKIALELTQKYNIPYIRFGWKSILKTNGSVSRVLYFLQKKNSRAYSKNQLASSDYFASLDWFKKKRLAEIDFPLGEIEIACHPERDWEMERIISFEK